MTERTQSPPSIAAVCDKHGPGAAGMEAYLREKGLSARWYPLRDLDDVDREVCAGRVNRVVLMSWDNLLEGIWNGEVSFERWLQMQVQVEFVESAGESASDCFATISQSWSSYKRSRRRRQIVSGIVLSAIALIAAFIIVQK